MVSAQRCDAVVVGGGPAGATLAARLAQLNRHVVLVEREEFPRFHVGESFLPLSCEVFDKLQIREDLDQRFLKKYGAVFVCSQTGREREYLFSDALTPRYEHAYQAQRAPFDALLLERARQLGVEVMQPCKAERVLFDGERAIGLLAHDGRDRITLEAEVIVDSSGRSSLLASRLGGKHRIADLDNTAIFAHFRDVPRRSGQAEGHTHVIIGQEGSWMWLIPLMGNLTSVGVVLPRRQMQQRKRGENIEAFFERMLTECNWLSDTLRDATRTSEVRSAADFSYTVERLAGPGWLCVGDACGFIDPLFSSGAHLAIKGADLAATAIDTALRDPTTAATAFSSYEQTIRKASQLFLRMVRNFYDGSFHQLLFAEEQRAVLRRIITSLLSGDVVHPQKDPGWLRLAHSAVG